METGNFQADIHDTGYEAAYLRTRLEAAGLVNTAGRGELESMDGLWNFAADWYDTCRRAAWPLAPESPPEEAPKPLDYDWEAWERMRVPSTWNTERRELRYFEGSGVYTRTFRYVPRAPGERLFLRFEGAAYRATVFLNGRCLGTHDGASTPFTPEATDAVQTENRLVVVTDARRLPQRVPMENTDWFNYGGLYRSVSLVRVPRAFIKDYFVRLVPGSACSRIRAEVWLSDGAEGTVTLSIPSIDITLNAKTDKGAALFDFEAHPALWSPGSPTLHEVTITLKNDDGTVDAVREKIGFKEIAVHDGAIFLNGEKIFLKGISVHEDHVLLGKTTTPEVIRATIRDLKEMHGLYLRLAHYPHDPRFARIADEEGVLLWEEIPVYWAIDFANEDTYRDAENQLAELVLRDRNRASVAIWSVGNENADTDARLRFMSRLAQKARALDGTRPVSAACLINHVKLKIEDRLADALDIIGINEYYGWYDPDFSKLPAILANSRPEKPVVICEFGGGARAGHRGSADDLFTEDFQKRLYERQIETLRACPYIAGTSPWILYDFRCPRRLNRYQQGCNRKGLIASDRVTRKAAFFVMQAFYGGM
jgi:beta-glucuronidase